MISQEIQKNHLTKLTLFSDKNSQQTRNRRACPQLDKEHIQKTIVNIILMSLIVKD